MVAIKINTPSEVKDVERALDSRFLKALAEPVRIEILKLLLINGPSDIASVARHLPQDRSVISRHLSLMRDSEILISSKDGRQVIYEINGPSVLLKLKEITSIVEKAIKHCCST